LAEATVMASPAALGPVNWAAAGTAQDSAMAKTAARVRDTVVISRKGAGAEVGRGADAGIGPAPAAAKRRQAAGWKTQPAA
jgi:hypothetical protein